MHIKLCAFVILRRDNQILLLRDAKHQERLKLPGGKVEDGEHMIEAAIREVHEELDVTIAATALTPIHYADFFWLGVQYMGMVFLAEDWNGVLVNHDPVDHAELVWAPLSDLPFGLLAPLKHAIQSGLAGTFYAPIGEK
jgi:8-oxo-dGTP diphosphatase